MPLQRRLPKFGFKNPTRVEFQAVNVAAIDKLAAEQKLEAVTVETDDEICLVKIKVKTDDPEALERWLERGDDEDVDEGSSAEGDNPLPDDNISQYGGDDDSQDA